jgi:hypothetical protein
MIQKIVKIRDLEDNDSIKADLEYWLSKSPTERLAAVEYMRRQYHGNTARLQKNLCSVHHRATENAEGGDVL